MKKFILLAVAVLLVGALQCIAQTNPIITFPGPVQGAPTLFKLDGRETIGVRLPPIPTAISAAGCADHDRQLLWAIREVETGNNPRAIGRLGERGAYQFRRHTWRQLSGGRPFQMAHTAEADTVARRFLRWLENGLVSGGVTPTPFNLALAWNAGLERVLSGNIPRASIDYAARVSRLARPASNS